MSASQFLTPRQMAGLATPIVQAHGGPERVAQMLDVQRSNVSRALNEGTTKDVAMLRRILVDVGGYRVATMPAYECTPPPAPRATAPRVRTDAPLDEAGLGTGQIDAGVTVVFSQHKNSPPRRMIRATAMQGQGKARRQVIRTWSLLEHPAAEALELAARLRLGVEATTPEVRGVVERYWKALMRLPHFAVLEADGRVDVTPPAS